MKKVVDARGLACPLPVVNTKNEISNLTAGDEVETIVDNEIAVQNLTKFANVRGYAVSSNKVNDKEYRVFMTIKETEVEDEVIECMVPANNDVVVLSSKCMGLGDDKLGASLMKAFTFALTKQDQLPKTILLYNSGVYLSTIEDSVEDLKFLESQGVEILSCGTCLNHYGLTEKLHVGAITNMYEIVEKMEKATKVIKP